MEEKKLDKDINVCSKDDMLEVALVDTLKECAIKFSQDSYIYRVLAGAIELIHRLQDENKELSEIAVTVVETQGMNIELVKKNAEQKAEIEKLSFYKTVFDKGLAVSLVNMQETIDKQKAEIERLTKEKKTLIWLNQDLKKQVDELKEENTELYKEHTTLIAGSILKKQDIAKDTAREILDEVSKHFGGRWLVELYKKYGLDWSVEVE